MTQSVTQIPSVWSQGEFVLFESYTYKHLLHRPYSRVHFSESVVFFSFCRLMSSEVFVNNSRTEVGNVSFE